MNKSLASFRLKYAKYRYSAVFIETFARMELTFANACSYYIRQGKTYDYDAIRREIYNGAVRHYMFINRRLTFSEKVRDWATRYTHVELLAVRYWLYFTEGKGL